MLFPDHPYLEPRHFVDEKAVNENHKDYMFLECILFITEVRGGVRETPRQPPGWSKQRWWLWTEEPELLLRDSRAGPEGWSLKRKPH